MALFRYYTWRKILHKVAHSKSFRKVGWVFFSQDSGLKITTWYITQTLQLYQNKHNWHLE